ncbi:MAG TPA: hypothetical protein VF812_09875 [Ktedonobacterales bacterium]
MSTDHPDTQAGAASQAPAVERLRALLADLTELQTYLDERGAHTYNLAQQFLANARRDASSRAYDERQATMLEYQHYIWREIAGRVGKLVALYGDGESPDTPDQVE